MVAVLAGATYAALRVSGKTDKVSNPEKVVIVFSGPAADGAQVAQVIAVTDGDGNNIKWIDPETTVTVVGTSYNTLRDAYPFTGAKGIAKGVAGEKAGWIDVPLSAWTSVLSAAGDFEVTMPATMDVFDGSKLYTFSKGKVKVSAKQLPSLLKGMSYLNQAQRVDIRAQVGVVSLKALGKAAKTADGINSNLADADYNRVVR